jgi:large subunit ribosomal protein L20
MSRVKRGKVTKRRHKKLLKQAKGYWGQRKNVYRRVHETVLRAMAYAFKGRKLKKRSMRSLFIIRISAAVGQHNMNYHTFMYGLKLAHIELDRKMLSQIAVADPVVFTQLVAYVQKNVA